MHLKSYKYSSVDKSPVSYYILRHYVCDIQRLQQIPILTALIVELVRPIATAMARSESCYPAGLLLHPRECHTIRGLCP